MKDQPVTAGVTGYRPWVICLILGVGLALLFVTLWRKDDQVEDVPKKTAAEAKAMVDAIVNRNKAAELVYRRNADPMEVALYPETYDWEEEHRVREAIDRLYQDRATEVWEELIRRSDDEHYCVTVVSKMTANARNRSVGSICSGLAYSRLVTVAERLLPRNPERPSRSIPVDFGVGDRLPAWRKERANKELHELQIEVCEKALLEVSASTLPKEEKDVSVKKLRAEINRLQMRKQPVILADDFANLNGLYSRTVAERVRTALERERDADVKLIP
jgi:hypothetical protein